MYLANNSTTYIYDGLVSGNQAKTGSGIYEQNDNAFLNASGLTDDDDPGGQPVIGP
jgi:hypothetical protein